MRAVITLELVDGGGPWPVSALVGEEAMSELFAFRLALRVPLDSIHTNTESFTAALLGQLAELRLTFDPEIEGQPAIAQTRFGTITRVAHVGVIGAAPGTELRVDCTLSPRAHVLGLRKRNRIFQDEFVHQIVSKVLTEHGLVHFWSLTGRNYPRRKYCTQYGETDWEFVTRLFAEEGIAFYFVHVPPGTHDERGKKVIEGGATPLETPPGTISDTLNTIAGVAEGVGGAAGGMGGTLGVIGAAAGLAGGLLGSPEADPDAIDVLQLPSVHSAGPSAPAFGDVLCFVDTAEGLARTYPGERDNPAPSLPLVLALREATNMTATGREISDLVPSQRATVGSVMQRDHDFRRPLLEQRATAGATTWRSSSATDLEVYEPQGDYDPPYITDDQARARLEQLQADGFVVGARSLCPRVQPGHSFELDAGTAPRTEHAVVRVFHTWVEAGAVDPAGVLARLDPHRADRLRHAGHGYGNALEFVGADTLLRPAVPTRSPRATCDTAVVTGPAGQEIYTDKLGRVKVQLHWDRDGIFDAHTSCWIRVAQPWVGAGYGFQFIPRVGAEVVVSYVGGDPDRPIVTGSLFDGTHPFPEPLPERATRSAIRTQSSPGGGGFHEVVFEDAKGAERLTVRSQGRLEEEAKGPHDLTVGEDQRVLVGGAQSIGVTGDRTVGVGGKLVEQVGDDRTDTVGGSATLRVADDRTASVQGDTLDTVGGLAIRVSGEHDVTVVGGSRSLSVKGDALTYVGGGSKASHATTFVDGNAYFNAKGSVTVQGLTTDGDGASKIRLSVGTSFVEIAHDRITLSAENLTLVGTSTAAMTGHGHTVKLSDDGGAMKASPAVLENADGTKVKLDGSDLKLTASGSAETKAGSIKLNSGSGSGSSAGPDSSPSSSPPDANVKLEMTHHHFTGSGGTFTPAKMSGVPARVSFGTTVLTGIQTNGDGVLEVHVPDGVDEIEVALLIDQIEGSAKDDYIDLYGGGPIVFRVQIIGSDPPAADTAAGKRIRLQNLGYEPGSVDDDATASGATADPDNPTVRAVERFQLRQDLLDAEHLDDDTKTRLEQLFGR